LQKNSEFPHFFNFFAQNEIFYSSGTGGEIKAEKSKCKKKIKSCKIKSYKFVTENVSRVFMIFLFFVTFTKNHKNTKNFTPKFRKKS